jgi:26S proteasome regulatory subunit N1
LIVTRIKDKDENVQKIALESLRESLKTKGTVTSIPKPLKFIRVYYEELTKLYCEMENEKNKIAFANILSLIAMIAQKEGSRDCLNYKLKGSLEDISEYGHEYLRYFIINIRYLSGELGQEFQKREQTIENFDNKNDIKDLQLLIDVLVPYQIKQQSEADACDLLMEVGQLRTVIKYSDERNYHRIGLYLTSISLYLLEPEVTETLLVSYEVYRKMKKYPEALRIALKINDKNLIKKTFDDCDDE